MPVGQERSYRGYRSSKQDQSISVGSFVLLQLRLRGSGHARARGRHRFRRRQLSRMVWFRVFLGRVLDKEGNCGLPKCLKHMNLPLIMRRFTRQAKTTRRLSRDDWRNIPIALIDSMWPRQFYGFTTTLPNMRLFSRYSWAARRSLSGNVRSNTGFSRPAKTWPRTSCRSAMVPM